MKMKMTTSTQRPMTPTAMPTISPRESGGVVAKREGVVATREGVVAKREGVVAKREEGGWGRGSVKGRGVGREEGARW